MLEERFPFLNKSILQTRIQWSINLRWIAITGFLLATLLARSVFQLDIPYEKVWGILAILAVINLSYLLIAKIHKSFSFRKELYFLAVHIVIDLLALSWLINMTGGIENPMYIFFIFHIVLSSILFQRPVPYYFATFAVVLFSGLVVGEYVRVFTHHCIFHADLHENIAFSILVVTVFTMTVYITTYIATSFMWIFRESKREIDGLNNELLRIDEEKARFFRFTSHELKSPLIAVQTSIDSVKKSYAKNLDARGLTILQRASDRCRQMLDIIKELLMLSGVRGQQGLPAKHMQKLNLVEILNKIILNNLPLARQKNINIMDEFSQPDVWFWGNPEEMEQVFGNLISNALRYNKPGGSVKVSVKTFGDMWLLAGVSDTGIGIPEKAKAHIFDEFYRAENAKKATAFGTGLGLSLVRQIVENYGGRIDIDSKEGEGTSFKITLPLNRGNDVEQEVESR